jgi:hypothetical protein
MGVINEIVYIREVSPLQDVISFAVLQSAVGLVIELYPFSAA